MSISLRLPLPNLRLLQPKHLPSLLNLHMPTLHQLPISTQQNPINNPIHERHALHQDRIFLLRLPIRLPLLLRKPLPDRLDHLAKPVEIERIQHHITPQIDATQPCRHVRTSRVFHDLIADTPCLLQHAGVVDVERGPDIGIDAEGLVGAPHEATAKEGGEEEDTVVPLGLGAGHVEFVEEPVEVEKRGGELVEDECRAVEIDKGSLERY